MSPEFVDSTRSAHLDAPHTAWWMVCLLMAHINYAPQIGTWMLSTKHLFEKQSRPKCSRMSDLWRPSLFRLHCWSIPDRQSGVCRACQGRNMTGRTAKTVVRCHWTSFGPSACFLQGHRYSSSEIGFVLVLLFIHVGRDSWAAKWSCDRVACRGKEGEGWRI